MIAVDGGGDGGGGESGGDELEHSHLGSGILHGDAIGAEAEVAHTALDLLGLRVIEMAVYYFLGIGEWTVEATTDNLKRREGLREMRDVQLYTLCLR